MFLEIKSIFCVLILISRSLTNALFTGETIELVANTGRTVRCPRVEVKNDIGAKITSNKGKLLLAIRSMEMQYDHLRDSPLATFKWSAECSCFRVHFKKLTANYSGSELSCDSSGKKGLSSTLKTSHKLTVKVIEAPIITEPSNVEQIGVLLNYPNKPYICRAKVHPSSDTLKPPTVTWVRKLGDSPLSIGDGSASLSLRDLSEEDLGSYFCVAVGVAETDSVNDQLVSTREVILVKDEKPSIDIVDEKVFTDLGTQETVKFRVTGSPLPSVICHMAMTTAPLYKSEPKHQTRYKQTGELEYIFHEVRHEDLGEYTCTAKNRQGKASQSITLLLGPSQPVIVSSNYTNKSDFYKMKFRSETGSPLVNITAEIYRKDKNSSEFVSHSVATLSGKLLPNKDLVTGREHLFESTLTKLKDDSLHRVRVKVCNRHNCSPYSKHAHFWTAPFDGKNAYPPVSGAQTGNSGEKLFPTSHLTWVSSAMIGRFIVMLLL